MLREVRPIAQPPEGGTPNRGLKGQLKPLFLARAEPLQGEARDFARVL